VLPYEAAVSVRWAGSSTSSNASEAPVTLPLPSKRLVTVLFIVTVKFAVGITEPCANGVPPVQVSRISPVNSV